MQPTYQTYTLSDSSLPSLLEVVPERGGIISRWQVQGQEILYLDAERFANPELSVRGGIPILFPICGNLPNNHYTYQDQSFELKQHGFARDLPWSVTAASATSLTLVLNSNEATRKVYPFEFQLAFTYQLAGNVLEIDQRFSNRGAEPMPFSVGLHPYFLTQNKSQLEFEIPASHGWDQQTQEAFAFAGSFDFDRPEIDLALGPLSRSSARLIDRDRQLGITLSYENLYSLLVFWSINGKNYCCLEPWSGPRNALNSGEGLAYLAPGETRLSRVSFQVDFFD